MSAELFLASYVEAANAAWKAVLTTPKEIMSMPDGAAKIAAKKAGARDRAISRDRAATAAIRFAGAVLLADNADSAQLSVLERNGGLPRMIDALGHMLAKIELASIVNERAPGFRHLGKGRRNAADGDAWTGAIATASARLAQPAALSVDRGALYALHPELIDGRLRVEDCDGWARWFMADLSRDMTSARLAFTPGARATWEALRDGLVAMAEGDGPEDGTLVQELRMVDGGEVGEVA